jgi:purine nucleosidase
MLSIHRCCLSSLFLAFSVLSIGPHLLYAQAADATAQKVIIDTDVGDDIDDAFAIALALESPELQVLEINADFGDTPLRARLLHRFLISVDRSDIPVATGVETPATNIFSQRRYAERDPDPGIRHADAVQSTLDLIQKYPGQITLICIGPYVNAAAMIDKDPATFRKLKRVVLMGGSIYAGYLAEGELGYIKPSPPSAEWNVSQDISGARKLFASDVPIYMMPLDATQLKLDEVKRNVLFSHDSPITDQLVVLYYQWGKLTPTLFDPMAVAYAINPDLCPTTPMRIEVDDRGYTKPVPGRPNAHVCLRSDSDKFFNFYIPRLLK